MRYFAAVIITLFIAGIWGTTLMLARMHEPVAPHPIIVPISSSTAGAPIYIPPFIPDGTLPPTQQAIPITPIGSFTPDVETTPAPPLQTWQARTATVTWLQTNVPLRHRRWGFYG